MKKILTLIVLLTVFMIFGSFTKTGIIDSEVISTTTFYKEIQEQKETYVVSSEYASIHSGPGSKYNIVVRLSKGMKVELIQKGDFASWYTVKHGEISGFIKSDNLELSASPVPPVAEEVLPE